MSGLPESGKGFIFSKPSNFNLQKLIDTYFYIDSNLDSFTSISEQIIPFPRVTFGYFFDSPFQVKNLSNGEKHKINIAIAKIQNTTVEVTPTNNRIKILGAHLKPYALSSFTSSEIKDLPWLINPFSLFETAADRFYRKINDANNIDKMFDEVEKSFLEILILQNLDLIALACSYIETQKGNCTVADVAKYCNCSERTLWNHTVKHTGISPKELILLTKIKSSVFDMLKRDESITEIAYENNFSDQAHFINTMKSYNTTSPGKLSKKLPTFRFLQF